MLIFITTLFFMLLQKFVNTVNHFLIAISNCMVNPRYYKHLNHGVQSKFVTWLCRFCFHYHHYCYVGCCL